VTAGVGILGVGRAIGTRLHSNEELCSTTLPGTTPEWIIERTGITRRYVLGDGESASSLALAASRAALEQAGVTPAELGMIVVTTFSGDYLFPPMSARLHRDLGSRGGQFYDLQANCSGFVSALTAVADRLRADPTVGHALVVGVEVLSPFVDYGDVETAIYFSDGAGAAVVGPVSEDAGVQASAFFADTSNFESVRLRGGGSSFPFNQGAAGGPDGDGARSPGLMEMNGLATWKQAVTYLPPTVRRACAAAGWQPDDVDLFVFHQANLQIISYVMRKMRVPMDRTYTNVQEIGNTGAASIPIALADAVAAGRLAPGSRVVLAGVGAGFGFGATCLTWDAGR
jgi:3-oxoacyl-[acyl-carrier-protein] synthase III